MSGAEQIGCGAEARVATGVETHEPVLRIPDHDRMECIVEVVISVTVPVSGRGVSLRQCLSAWERLRDDVSKHGVVGGIGRECGFSCRSLRGLVCGQSCVFSACVAVDGHLEPVRSVNRWHAKRAVHAARVEVDVRVHRLIEERHLVEWRRTERDVQLGTIVSSVSSSGGHLS